MKTALIGIGYWGKNLARNLFDLGVLDTICDIDPKTLNHFKGLYPELSFTQNYQDVLGNPAIPAVVIATPAVSHYELAKEALLAGKDVYVEKPLCLDYTEGKELIELAKREGRILMVGHILQYHPCVRKIQELVQQEELGELRYLSSNRLNLGKICTVESSLWSYATHDIGMILSLTERLPHTVRCTGGTYLKEGVADTTLTTLSFDGNIEAHIYVSWLNPFKEQKLTLIGSKAMLVFDDTQPWDEKLLIFRDYLPNGEPNLTPERIEVEQKEPLKEECLHFLHCCATRQEPETGGQTALDTLYVLQLAQETLEKNATQGYSFA